MQPPGQVRLVREGEGGEKKRRRLYGSDFSGQDTRCGDEV